MIHDPTIEVTCDGEHCPEWILLPPLGANARDSLIDREVEREGWIVSDGKHYCSEECKP